MIGTILESDSHPYPAPAFNSQPLVWTLRYTGKNRNRTIRRRREEYLNETHCVIPVHELQTVKVQQLFEDVSVLPESINLPALAQSSIQ